MSQSDDDFAEYVAELQSSYVYHLRCRSHVFTQNSSILIVNLSLAVSGQWVTLEFSAQLMH